MFNNPTPFMLMKAFLTFFAISLICLLSHGQFNFDKQIKSNVKYSENIIDEVISLIGNMYYGRKEDENFNKMFKIN